MKKLLIVTSLIFFSLTAMAQISDLQQQKAEQQQNLKELKAKIRAQRAEIRRQSIVNTAKHEFRLGVGFSSLPLFEYGYCDCMAWYNWSTYGGNYGPLMTSGMYSFNYSYAAKRWLGVGVTLNVEPLWADYMDPYAGKRLGVKTGAQVAILPTLRFNYFRGRAVSIYSELQIGALYQDYPAVCSHYYDREQEFHFALQGTPFGISFGKKFFGFAELGIGNIWLGLHGGIGYRF